jgi:hypothetical protein
MFAWIIAEVGHAIIASSRPLFKPQGIGCRGKPAPTAEHRLAG